MDIDKLDKTAKKIGVMYEKGLKEIINILYKSKDETDSDKFVEQLGEVDVKTALQNKMQNIKVEYAKGHIEALEAIPPKKK